MHAETSPTNQLQRLTARSLVGNDERGFQRLVVERTPAGFVSRVERGELQASPRLASGIIRSSLFASTDEAGMPDSVAIRYTTPKVAADSTRPVTNIHGLMHSQRRLMR